MQDHANARPGMFGTTAIVFREQISKHKIPGRARRILDKVIRYSLERGQFKALIPTQQCFCLLCGMDKADVSREIKWLREKKILVFESWDHGRGGEAWGLYSLSTPNQWDVSLRRSIGPAETLNELEAWLLKASIDQPDLIDPPPSLQDLLFENFVECSAPEGPGARVDRAGGPVGETPTQALGPVGETPTQALGPVGETPTQALGPVGETPTQMVRIVHSQVGKTPTEGAFPIDRARASDRSIEPNRIDRKVPLDRVLESIDRRPRADFAGYVEERLFRLIGEHERQGPMARAWFAALNRIPERLNELIATAEAMQRERTIRTTAVRWLNASVRNEMAGTRPS